MPHSSDSSDSSFSRSPPPGHQDSSDDVRKVQRREKNRIAAQKSRQRQTQKADTLHLHHMVHLHFLPSDEITSEFTQQAWGLQPMQLVFPDFREKLLAATYQSAAIKQRESEDLEKQNAALRKEIKQLTEEMKYFTSVLSSHEPLCSVMATSTPSPPEVVYSTHAFHQPHVSSPRFQP
ncbi:Basic leucine zipper transcriptional factor ATF-like protein [Pteropus alecto]|uniref:Basic leucine zipper transcriptional factor ATF-like n=1 Tax=Pteropus alecto TaxID=9402 RepID=L5JNY8_PTEAL|nr:Basic leucine zipper transcriptional factor ATF-like protein [Pteropus alecto]